MMDTTTVFEQERRHLRAVAYRLLGSVHEADDAVQEAWLRLERSDLSTVRNVPAWLTTVVSRICLDELRTRATRRVDLDVEDVVDTADDAQPDPAGEAERADDVGRALLVVLDTLAPAERIAFCLHDLFGFPFEEIAATLGRSAAACRQLASRGRRRVRGQGDALDVDRARQRELVEAFLTASREGRFDQLLAVLHPHAVLSSDATAAAMGSPTRLEGRTAVAEMMNGKARAARLALLDDFACAQWSHRGEVKVVFAFTVEDGLIQEIELIGTDPDRLDLRTRAREVAG